MNEHCFKHGYAFKRPAELSTPSSIRVLFFVAKLELTVPIPLMYLLLNDKPMPARRLGLRFLPNHKSCLKVYHIFLIKRLGCILKNHSQ